MPLETFNNLEANSSVREKINLAIDAINNLNDNLDSLGLVVTGIDEVQGALTLALEEVNEEIQDIKLNGVPVSSTVIPIEIDYTGNWISPTIISSLPTHALSYFPSGIFATGNGAWVRELDLYEDNLPDGLTSMSFPNLSGVAEDLYIANYQNLATLNFNELVSVGEYCEFYGLPLCEEITVPKLKVVGGNLQINGLNSLVVMEFPALIASEDINFYSNENLTTINLEVLESLENLYINGNSSLYEINLNSLKYVKNNFEITNNPLLNSIQLDDIIAVDEVNLSNQTSNITSFIYGPNLKEVAGNQRFNDASLDAASVNNILTSLGRLDGTNGTVEFKDREIQIAGQNSAFSTTEALLAIQALYDRNVYGSFNYPDIQFNITGASFGGSVGYFEGQAGSATNSIVLPFLTQISANGTELVFEFVGPYAVYEAMTYQKSLWINGNLMDGQFENVSEDTWRFVPSQEQVIPTFVNGQTNLIEIK